MQPGGGLFSRKNVNVREQKLSEILHILSQIFKLCLFVDFTEAGNVEIVLECFIKLCKCWRQRPNVFGTWACPDRPRLASWVVYQHIKIEQLPLLISQLFPSRLIFCLELDLRYYNVKLRSVQGFRC